jgi:DNA-binding MarR family transcriptional regulator
MNEVNQQLNAPGIGDTLAFLQEHEVSIPRFMVLRLLAHNEGATISHVATRLKLALASASQLIDRLEQDGYVSRREDDDDRRIKRIYLLERGRAVVSDVQCIAQHSLQQQLMQLPAATVIAMLNIFSETNAMLRKEAQ